ncbi:hypothetical protein ACFXTO_014473 [Malus domestica]
MTINDLVEVKQYKHEFAEDFIMSELQELVIAATKYEKLLIEEQQVKHSSKVPPFYKNKVAIHQVEFEGAEPEESDGHGGEGI